MYECVEIIKIKPYMQQDVLEADRADAEPLAGIGQQEPLPAQEEIGNGERRGTG